MKLAKRIRVKARRVASTLSDATVLRREAFSLAHLEQHARDLAERLQIAPSEGLDDRSFVRRFEENSDFVRAAHQQISKAIADGEPLSRDAEWLLDNFYVVEQQLWEIRDDLPRAYYLELPKLPTGEPRVYVLALELITHTDSALDEEAIVRFVQEFQATEALSIGEIWAVPIMLRLGLVESLRRLTAQMVSTRECRERARKLLEVWRPGQKFDIDLSSLECCAPLVFQMVEQLKDQGAEFNSAMQHLERQLAEQALASDEVIRNEHQRQASNQVSIGNVITSMRLISALDWVAFFERTNLAEQTLRNDPAGFYAAMDFASRDRYRHAVEQLHKGSDRSDLQVAEQAVAMAEQAAKSDPSGIDTHVGFWLVDRGRERLERAIGFRPRLRDRIKRWCLRHPNSFYIGSIGFITLAALWCVGMMAADVDAALGATIALFLLALLPASEIAVGLVNRLVTAVIHPRLLPKLELKEGVPSQMATVVVIPALVSRVADINTFVERLEVHYLANPEANLRFALLTDFADAPQEHMPHDAELLDKLVAAFRELNQRYRNGHAGPFYLFHRPRRWNAQQATWMSWERKRGKLLAFNAWLRGKRDDSFSLIEGDVDALVEQNTRYVITLDADTQLPHRTARKLIGTIAHPLNRAQWNANKKRVSRGYAVLQPRLGVHLASANRSWFARIFANSPGIDPYAQSASDVYQDLYGEGSFTGKAIYDLETFDKALHDVLPENRILSHDLIEGCYTRVGLVSDIELIDSYPSRYDAEMRRQHRWARGDWQISDWVLPRVPSAEGPSRSLTSPHGSSQSGRVPNPLSPLSRWKIFDNLRRSLVPAALCLFLLVGWFAVPQGAWYWSAVGVVVLGFPLLLQLVGTARSLARGRQAWEDFSARPLAQSVMQLFIAMACLPHKGYVLADAVVRTLWRIWYSKRRLLEWETADATELRLSKTRWTFPPSMLVLSAIAVLLAFVLPNAAVPAAFVWLVAWISAPALVRWLSKTLVDERRLLSDAQRQQLRRIARQTWAFFEHFVTEADHWLPPDNVQEYPTEKIAHRISPTNEGLFLVSGLVAHDLGYIAAEPLALLWERNLDNWQQLDRLHGHYYNWYDTVTLAPLMPRYVSTVDSGNMVACLLTLRQGSEDLVRRPLIGPQRWAGFSDTIDLVEEACAHLHPPGLRFVSPALDALTKIIAEMRSRRPDHEAGPVEWRKLSWQLKADGLELQQRLETFASSGMRSVDVTAKVALLVRWIDDFALELEAMFPWVDALAGISAELPIAVGANSAESNSTESSTTAGPLRRPGNIRPGSDAELAWQKLHAVLSDTISIDAIRHLPGRIAAPLTELRAKLRADHDTQATWLTAIEEAAGEASTAATALWDRYAALAQRMEDMALAMDFRFLFHPQRRLFAIGFNIEDSALDRSYYDLLCSEARLASYLAIAKGDAEPQHWFQLGRPMTQTAGQVSLLSWGGTMFEFLMPTLFQTDFEGSLLSQSYQAAVARQIEFGRQHDVPWGVSESAFGALAVNSDYQYRSFGVPGLGLKRGLSKDVVISPYSTMLALEVDPTASLVNLKRLEDEGAVGAWGYYDALDYTPQRAPAGKRAIVVRCYMAHHQGMGLLAISNALSPSRVRNWFGAHPLARSPELLLQERATTVMPRMQVNEDEITVTQAAQPEEQLVSRRLGGYDTAAPRTHLLSNGRYTVMVTNTGGGFSQCDGLAVTRSRPDTTLDAWGQFVYLRDMQSGRAWSATYQPLRAKPDSYEVIYSIDKAEFHRRDGDWESHLEIVVSSENNAEIRQLRLTNHGTRMRTIEITSYAEIVLAPPNADLAHPAFGKLFVETEYVAEENAILARRRPRDAQQQPLWGVHVLACSAEVGQTVCHETCRDSFLGRNRGPDRPRGLDRSLSGKTGAVLDPIMSLRAMINVHPGESTTIAFTTALAGTREEALSLADQYHDMRGVQRAFELAWAFSQVQLRHHHLSPAQVHLFQRLASAVLYPDPAFRGPSQSLLENQQGQRGLWRYGISGDVPIVLMRVTSPEQIGVVRELLGAHQYWKSQGLQADVVVLNDYPGSYFDALQEQLTTLVNEVQHKVDERPTGIFILRGAQIPQVDQQLLEAAAAIVFRAEAGALSRQLEMALAAQVVSRPPAAAPTPVGARKPVTAEANGRAISAIDQVDRPTSHAARTEKMAELELSSGHGGFALDGREYRICIEAAPPTPTPWSNVLANPSFGCLVTESGGGYTWNENSRENKLTPWANDPVTDSRGEIGFISDLESGELWPQIPRSSDVTGQLWVSHGQGVSRFEHTTSDVEHRIEVFIAPDDPVKFVRVQLRNTGQRPRELAVTYYVEWVLGVTREQTQWYVNTSIDKATGALLARNGFHFTQPLQVAFLHALSEQPATAGASVTGASTTGTSVTGDRSEFFGRNGNRREPAALRAKQLSGRTGGGLDPCGAVQTKVTIAPGATAEVTFLIGAGKDVAHAESLLGKYRTPQQVAAVLEKSLSQWDQILSSVEIRTPNRAMDLMINRWLLYQTLSCRFWGRSAYYQSGGAYGFRDQLQDSMALVFSRPDLVREHLLRAAARQFVEGDVQHWWHTPEGAGIRTRYSDDYLWLPWVTGYYIRSTGDTSVFDEVVPFLQSPLLEPREHERFEVPAVSQQQESLYEHCRRSLVRGMTHGPHGLPLMGGGDWNDGMNRVGVLGQGESVWVGWFQLVLIRDFVPLMRARGDDQTADDLEQYARQLRVALEEHAWDGAWYRRAFFDDGTPLGSQQNDECQIDSIAQSWSVMAEADPQRSREAIRSAMTRLVRKEDKISLLLTPPFDKTALDPGYIRGYLPGVRENGGQYTHAAIWLLQAQTQLSDADAAMSLFDLINPVNHALTSGDVSRYQVEPYVVAADVYGTQPHTGRGGWTWYTGSSAWLYRVALEDMLGLRLQGDKVTIRPCVPESWHEFEITLRRGGTTWHFRVQPDGANAHGVSPHGENTDSNSTRSGNGQAGDARSGIIAETSGDAFTLSDDGQIHEIVIRGGKVVEDNIRSAATLEHSQT